MMCKGKRSVFSFLAVMAIMLFLMIPMAFAGEADIKLPDLTAVSFMGGALNGILIRMDAVRPDEAAAVPSSNARCLCHHLGNL
jgi:hypothetical protein